MQDRRSVAVACIAQHYRITVSLDQRGRGFNQKTVNVMARLVLVHCLSRLNQDGLGDEEEEERFGGGVEPAGRCTYTPERWDQFWWKVDRWGYPVAT